MYYQSTARYHRQQAQRKQKIEISLLQVVMSVFSVVLGFVLPVNLYEYYKYQQAHPAVYTAQTGQVAGITSESVVQVFNSKDSLMAMGLALVVGALLISFYLLINLLSTPPAKTKTKVALDEYNFA